MKDNSRKARRHASDSKGTVKQSGSDENQLKTGLKGQRFHPPHLESPNELNSLLEARECPRRLVMPMGKRSPWFRRHSACSDFALLIFGGTITRREPPYITSDLGLGGGSTEGDSKTERTFEVNLREGSQLQKSALTTHAGTERTASGVSWSNSPVKSKTQSKLFAGPPCPGGKAKALCRVPARRNC